MEVNEFIKNVISVFEETEESKFSAGTRFKDLDEWSSLVALGLLNMIGKKYSVILKIDDIGSIFTIQELFDLVNAKRV